MRYGLRFAVFCFMLGIALSACTRAQAQSITCPVPYLLQNGTVADATQVMTNFNTLIGCFATLGTGKYWSSDWLTPIFPNTTQIAKVAGLSDTAGIGLVGSTRTSDGANGGYGIGTSGFCDNNTTFGAPTACAAGYFETVHQVGANGQVYSHGIEIDIDEMNSGTVNGVTFPVHYQPFTGPFPNGLSDALRLASGGVRPGVQPATDAIAIINNGSSFRSGIVFQQNSIFGTDGNSGQGAAIEMAKGHQINWYSPDGNINATIVGIGGSGTPTAVFEVGNGGVNVSSSTNAVLSVTGAAGANSSGVYYVNGVTNKYFSGIDNVGNNFIIFDFITGFNSFNLVSGNLTLGETGASVILNSTVKFGVSGNWSANGSVATTMTALGPVGSHTTVQKWLTIVDDGGVVRYVPAY